MLYDRRLGNDNCASAKVSTLGPAYNEFAYNEQPAELGRFRDLFIDNVLGQILTITTPSKFMEEQL